MWLLPSSGSASLEARPTTLNSVKDAGTSSRWVHAVQTTDTSNSLEVFVPPGRRIVTPTGARTIHSAAPRVIRVSVHRTSSGYGRTLHPPLHPPFTHAAGEDIMVPAGAKAGSLVILRVPESSCIESWSESHVGGAVGYAPTSGERPDLGAPDEAFVQAPSSMEAGDTFQVRAPYALRQRVHVLARDEDEDEYHSSSHRGALPWPRAESGCPTDLR